jgi:hypothetical protein
MAADTTATIINATVKLATAGFAEGGVVPYTGLHLVHEGERVLSVKQRADYEGMMAGTGVPAPFADQGRGGTTAGPHTSGGPVSHMTLNWHEGSVSALDPAGVSDVLKRSRSDLMKLVREGFKRGTFRPRELLR